MGFNSRMVEYLAPNSHTRREQANAEKVFSLWEEMQEQGVQPNGMTFNFLLRACTLARSDLDSALDIFQDMLARGFHPTRVTYNALLSTCAVHGAVTEVFEVLEAMQESGVAPDLLSHQQVVTACTRSKLWRRAVTHMEDMRKQGMHPNSAMLRAVANRAMDDNSLSVAVQLLEDITRTPEPVPVQIVMRCLSLATMRCSVDVIRRSMAVLDFSHHVVDEGTLLMVMNVAVSMRDTKLARDTYERAVKCDYDSPYFLASMIQAAGRAGDIDSTFALIEAAATHGIDVSAGVLRSIGLDLGGDEAAAKKIAEIAVYGDKTVSPAFAKVAMWTLGAAGRRLDVQQLAAEFRDRTGHDVDSTVCEAATAAFCRVPGADSRACEEIVQKLEDRGVEVTELALEHLAKAYILDRRTKKGINLIRAMREQGRTPTRATYAFVIRRCIVRHKLEDAAQLLEDAATVHPGAWTADLYIQLDQEREHQLWSRVFGALAKGNVPIIPRTLV